MREDNLTEFSNHIKGLSDKDLLIRALNMPEGTGAFNDLYKRLTKRMGEKKIDNIFNMIDTIAEEWGEGNDQIKDSLTISCITTLLTRDKVNDLEKWVNSYSEKDKLLALMGEGISLNEDLKKGFLQQYYTLKDMPLFEKLVNSVVNNDSRI
jgi:hypothetical protein